MESIDGIQEYSVMVGSVISEKEILTDEMLIINVSGSSEEKGVFTIQGEMTGDDLIYDIGYILDGHYTELDALNTDAVLDTKVEVKENTEFSWCITNRAESALNLSGMVSVIYDDLFYRNYGEGVIDIDTLCNITIHDISSLVAKEDLEGIYLYNCKTRESKKMAAALGNLEFQISTPGKYIIYAMTQESEVLNLMNFITVESVATDEQEKIIGL